MPSPPLDAAGIMFLGCLSVHMFIQACVL